MKIDISEVGERHERQAAGADTVAELAEHLSRAGVVVPLQAVGEAGKVDRAVRADIVPAIGRAGAKSQIAPARTAIDTDMITVAFA